MARVTIDLDRVDRASRLIRASVAEIHATLTDPGAVALWLPPDGMVASIHAYEPWAGGAIEFALTYLHSDDAAAGKSTKDSDVVRGRFVDLAADERMVWDIDFVSDDPACSGTMRMTWSLAPRDRNTLLTVEASNVPYGIAPDDHEKGLLSTLEKLAAQVES